MHPCSEGYLHNNQESRKQVKETDSSVCSALSGLFCLVLGFPVVTRGKKIAEIVNAKMLRGSRQLVLLGGGEEGIFLN